MPVGGKGGRSIEVLELCWSVLVCAGLTLLLTWHIWYSLEAVPLFKALAFLLDKSVRTMTLHLFFRSVNNQYCKKVIGGMVWNPVMRRSLSVERLETKSLPSRSPPITPNWYVLFYAIHHRYLLSFKNRVGLRSDVHVCSSCCRGEPSDNAKVALKL